MLPPDLPDDLGFPSLDWEPEYLTTRPMPLSELPLQTRLDLSMETIAAQHLKIAHAIVDFWGGAQCVEYIQALILNGDRSGENRRGFNPEVFTALMEVMALHQREYPSPPATPSELRK